MRMWEVNPRIMCTRHLLGEHVELHMFVSAINAGRSMEGYFNNNLLNVRKLTLRHSQLAKEMKRRDYKHLSPIPRAKLRLIPSQFRSFKVNRKKSLQDLLKRCKNCKNLYAKTSK